MVVDENDDKDDTDNDSMIATDDVGRMTEKMRIMMWLMGQIQNSIQGPPLNVMMQPLFQGVLK